MPARSTLFLWLRQRSDFRNTVVTFGDGQNIATLSVRSH